MPIHRKTTETAPGQGRARRIELTERAHNSATATSVPPSDTRRAFKVRPWVEAPFSKRATANLHRMNREALIGAEKGVDVRPRLSRFMAHYLSPARIEILLRQLPELEPHEIDFVLGALGGAYTSGEVHNRLLVGPHAQAFSWNRFRAAGQLMQAYGKMAGSIPRETVPNTVHFGHAYLGTGDEWKTHDQFLMLDAYGRNFADACDRFKRGWGDLRSLAATFSFGAAPIRGFVSDFARDPAAVGDEPDFRRYVHGVVVGDELLPAPDPITLPGCQAGFEAIRGVSRRDGPGRELVNRINELIMAPPFSSRHQTLMRRRAAQEESDREILLKNLADFLQSLLALRVRVLPGAGRPYEVLRPYDADHELQAFLAWIEGCLGPVF